MAVRISGRAPGKGGCRGGLRLFAWTFGSVAMVAGDGVFASGRGGRPGRETAAGCFGAQRAGTARSNSPEAPVAVVVRSRR